MYKNIPRTAGSQFSHRAGLGHLPERAGAGKQGWSCFLLPPLGCSGLCRYILQQVLKATHGIVFNIGLLFLNFRKGERKGGEKRWSNSQGWAGSGFRECRGGCVPHAPSAGTAGEFPSTAFPRIWD